MRAGIVLFVSLLVFVMASDAAAQARSSSPAEADIQQQLEQIVNQVQKAQQLQGAERTNVLRELERLLVKLQQAEQQRSGGTAGGNSWTAATTWTPTSAAALQQAAEALQQAAQAGGALPGQRGTGGNVAEGYRLAVLRYALNGGLNVQVAGGAWWTDSALVSRLGLTDDQKSKIEKAFTDHRLNLEATRNNLQREEAELSRLLDAEPLDHNAVSGQILRVSNARSEMERENAAMTLEMREQMTRSQWNLLQTLAPRATVMVEVPISPGGGAVGIRGGGGRGARGPQ